MHHGHFPGAKRTKSVPFWLRPYSFKQPLVDNFYLATYIGLYANIAS